MPETWSKLAQGQLGAAVAVLYTVPAGESVIVKHIRLVNRTATNRWAALWHDGATDAFAILPQTRVLSGGWGEFDGAMLLEAADTIQGQAEAAAAITYTIYGLRLS